MNNIAIVTFNGAINYGNKLQNFALTRTLRYLCGQCPVTLWPAQPPNRMKRLAKTILKKENGQLVLKGRGDYLIDHVDQKRKAAAEKFGEKFINKVSITDSAAFFTSKSNACYKQIIAGSDQIWNPLFWNKKDPMPEFNNYFLTFATPEKRIAYAASFGIDTIPPEWRDKMAAELVKFKAISVRETSGARIVKELTGRDVPVVLDPTLLLTADKWREIEPGILAGQPDKKYILTYFLGPQPQQVLDEVQAEARRQNAEVIEMMDPKCKYYTLGPDGFVEMIDHAQAVFTDSFHGTVFSILFHRPFRIYTRYNNDGSNAGMGSRLDTLLEKTGLTARIQAHKFPTPTDFAQADALLEKERESSMQFLRDALN